ncbi:MAG: 1-acyl-sn-glycerol-3-phosphate acyltransferase [Zoogloeaceae bacterium]|jgi:1-acyl-sn-glycerol-3-phosphate acyltransferase|nr:1-acyl-sn-glycerol-3-phosphate acyltransferase [Zoogloeaceae bacterium]
MIDASTMRGSAMKIMAEIEGMLDRPFRIIATAFCFAVFGLGGVLILCFVFPCLRFFYADLQVSQQHARRIIHRSFKWFVRLMEVCGVISHEVRQAEKLARTGLLIVANHPSLIDVVLLIALIERPNCVIKASLRDNVFTRGPVRSAGFVVNTDGPQLVADCVASVRSGDNLIIFPEGTRSLTHNGALNPLKRGAANIALRGGLPLTPVVITVSEPMLGKGQSWRDAPRKRPHFILGVEDDLPVTPYCAALAEEKLMSDDAADGGAAAGEALSAASRMARRLSRDLSAFFAEKITRQGADAMSADGLPRQ